MNRNVPWSPVTASEIYELGYQNGLQFGYIDDTLTLEELQVWGQGYRDAKENNHDQDKGGHP